MARQPLDYPVFDGQQQPYGGDRQRTSPLYQGQMYDWQRQLLEGGLWKWLFGTDIDPFEAGGQFHTNPFYSNLGIGSPASLVTADAMKGVMPSGFETGLSGLMSPDFLKRLGGSSQYGGRDEFQLAGDWRNQVLDYMFRPETFLQGLGDMYPSAGMPQGAHYETEDIYRMLSMLLGGGK